MKTFCFKLYRAKRNEKLNKQINAAGLIWNHCLALHKRYYKLFGKYLHKFTLSKHLTKLKRRKKFSYLKDFAVEYESLKASVQIPVKDKKEVEESGTSTA